MYIQVKKKHFQRSMLQWNIKKISVKSLKKNIELLNHMAKQHCETAGKIDGFNDKDETK